MQKTRIFLIGYMGSGKTTYGKLMAKELNISFIDLDDFIENKYLRTVSSLFDEFGESGFRKMERDSLHEVAQMEDCLIATGGGTPCFFDNIEYMNSMGETIYLRTSVRELRDRLKMSRTKRPLLSHKTDEELESNIAEMLDKREIFYMKAKFILDTDDLNPNNLMSCYQAMNEV